MPRTTPRWITQLETFGLRTSIASAAVSAIHGIGTAIAVLAVGLMITAALSETGRFLCHVWSCAGAGHLEHPLTDPFVRRHERPERVRPLAFRPTDDVLEALPPDPAGADLLPAAQRFALRAIGTRDLLTRRPVEPGDAVFVCLGQAGQCGATFPRDIRDEVTAVFQDTCPACGEVGRFTDTTVPGSPDGSTTTPTWEPTGALA